MMPSVSVRFRLSSLQLNQYRVVLEVKPDFKQNPAELQHLFVRGAGGGQVPLSAFTQTQRNDRTR